MRFLIVNTEYDSFLDWLYARDRDLAQRDYARQLQVRNDTCFGTADFYSAHLRRLGHEAVDVHFNNAHLQRAWAREHGLRVAPGRTWRWRLRRGIVPWPRRDADGRWLYQVLAAQVRHHRPDVLYMQNVTLAPDVVAALKPHVRLLVGQNAAPLPDRLDLTIYDLLLSSLPHQVARFRAAGIRATWLPLAVEPAVLDVIGAMGRDTPVSFVGNLFSAHGARRRWLDAVARRVAVDVWSPHADHHDRPAWRHHGPAWGLDMYRALRGSRITLNHHIDVAGPDANNMRLFEATAMGALLITDSKRNLHDLFEPGREVVTYRDADECVERIGHYLRHDAERTAIAEAGQRRTTREHSYQRRMPQLLALIEACLPRARRPRRAA